MAKEVQVRKTVFNKNQYTKVVDKSFRTFVEAPKEEDPTVDDFFELYNRLFFVIPADGEINSHRYLIARSSELVDFEKSAEDIQPLLDEIASLRSQLLLANKTVLELRLELAQNANK